MKKLFNFRWQLAIGIFLLSQQSQAQRNNVWLLNTATHISINPETTYGLDFNYCPPQFRKIFIEKDKYLKEIHIRYYGGRQFFNSFCDTAGNFAFTELIGQHYYNKNGIIYDSTYIDNNYYKYKQNIWAIPLTLNDRTYYFKAFGIYPEEINSKYRHELDSDSDSLFLTVSEFANDGKLLSKNKIIYRIKTEKGINNILGHSLTGKTLDNENVELIFNTRDTNQIVFNYNVKSNVIKFKPLITDSIAIFGYSTKQTKLIGLHSKVEKVHIFENNNSNYQLQTTIDFSLLPSPNKKYKFGGAVFIPCFAPNDSLLYVSLMYYRDTIGNKKYKNYLAIINIYNPYIDYKIIPVTTFDFSVPWFHQNGYPLKLGPDGNIYGRSGGRVEGGFRILHPNSLKTFKLEKLPELDNSNYRYNNSNCDLYISTLEDYKKTEFSWNLTCRGLDVLFTNTCDTQYFKRYRLFFDNGDSIDLGKNWNTKVYTYKKTGKYYVRLKAFSKTGGFIWYGDSIELVIKNQVNAGFGIQKTLGCQWVGYKFTDSSKLGTGKPGFTPYKKWFFGDGHDSLITGPNSHLTYKYTKSGNYSVKLIVNNGYCIDSVIKQNKVLILPAPQPGIIASPIDDCIPFNVGFKCKYNDVLDSAIWESGQGPNIQVKDIQGNFAYTKTGNFLLKQKLYGPSGCITRDSINIGAYALPKADFKALDVCETDSVSFNNLSPEARLYNWKFGDGQNSPKRSPQHFYKIDGKSTTFNVTLVTLVTKACADSVTKAVTINANPDSDFAYSINGRTVDLTAKQTGNTKYRWLLGNGDSSIKTSTSLNYTYANKPVQYTVCLKITNAAGCTSETCKYIDGESTGISQPNSLGILIYPNPNTGKFTLSIEKPEKDFSIEVYNLIGEKIKTLDTAPNKLSYSIDLAVTPGIYIVRVKNGFITFNQKVSISK